MARKSSVYSAVTYTTESDDEELEKSAGSLPAPRKSKSLRRKKLTKKTGSQDIAALTAPATAPNARMTRECLALLEAQQKELDNKIKRASLAYDQTSRQSWGNRPVSTATCLSTGGSLEHKYSTGDKTEDGAAQNGHREEGPSPESVRLIREKEKIVRWNAARENVEFAKSQQGKERETNQSADGRNDGAKMGAKRRKKPRALRVLLCGLF
jgi:PAB1-binding protein PBP1